MIVTLDDYAAQAQNCSGYLDPQFDWTQCINDASNAAGAGGTLLFTRGKTYRFGGTIYTSDPENDPLDGVTWDATGTGARPILSAPSITGFAIKVMGKQVHIKNLDIRGPWYGSSSQNSSRPKEVFCEDDGINASNIEDELFHGFHLIGCSVNGFNGHGVFTNMINDVLIADCQINYNANSGVVSFAGDHGESPAQNFQLLNNDLSFNGANGFDSEASSVVAIGNIANENGWNYPSDVDCRGDYDMHGEGHGLLFQARRFSTPIQDLVVSQNTCSSNRRHGINLEADAQNGFTDVLICSNTVQNNGTEDNATQCVGYGIRLGWNPAFPFCPPNQDAPMSNVVLVENVGGGNYDGDWNTPYPGVTEESHPPHTDEPHQDQHTDFHMDQHHHHEDWHADIHRDAGCNDPHQDLHTDAHDDAHGDEPGHLDHSDVPHFDWHTDFSGLTDEWNPEHCDATLLVGEPCHSDSHSDTPHGDSHGDSSHSDWHTDGHLDSHEDVPHCDEPHDDWHSDIHSDSGGTHVDSHGDTHADEDHKDVHGDACAPA